MAQSNDVQRFPDGVVVLEYNDLVAGKDLTAAVEEAYGFDGLGILAVRGVPTFVEKRQALLPLAWKFANLPEEVKAKTVHEASLFSVGWSHGKEKLEGHADFSKGSYYANPQHDRPVDDEEQIKKNPAYAHPNIWPDEDLPELAPAFRALGRLIVDVGTLVARQCDAVVAKRVGAGYPAGRLARIIAESRTCKARLLHYFPHDKETSAPGPVDEASLSTWCGWHNDHGSLTGLAPACYFSSAGVEVPNPDPHAGLYIRGRRGQLTHARVPADCIAYQIGESSQVHTGGVLQATPHCVRAAMGPGTKGVSRETFAVFMNPNTAEPMTVPAGMDPALAAQGSTAELMPKGVPTLGSRWKNDQDFLTFADETFKRYY